MPVILDARLCLYAEPGLPGSHWALGSGLLKPCSLDRCCGLRPLLSGRRYRLLHDGVDEGEQVLLLRRGLRRGSCTGGGKFGCQSYDSPVFNLICCTEGYGAGSAQGEACSMCGSTPWGCQHSSTDMPGKHLNRVHERPNMKEGQPTAQLRFYPYKSIITKLQWVIRQLLGGLTRRWRGGWPCLAVQGGGGDWGRGGAAR